MKLLIGGSPCTHWSIAQTKNRETKPSGIGWELFLNYKIARDKYQPDFFLYENNKSMSAAIREKITEELGVEPVLINSALVSAQSRQRLYWVGRRNQDGTYSQVHIEQPEDRGILLRDILESGTAWREKAYTLKAQYYKNGIANFVTNGGYGATGVAEPIIVNGTESGKARTVDAHMGKLENNLVPRINNPNPAKQQYDCIAEPVRIGTIENDAKNQEHDSKQYRVYSPDGKATTLCGEGGGVGAKTGLYAVPVPEPENVTADGKAQCLRATYYKDGIRNLVGNTVDRKTCVAVPLDKNGIAHLGSLYGQHSRWGVFAPEGKCPTITASMGMGGGHVPMVPKQTDEEGHCQKNPTTAKQIYEVRNGKIAIKGKEYPIKLADGFYIIRKLTVTECKRLQTVPDTYDFPVSDTQAYKMLGNGWTVDVIAHLLSHFEGLTAGPVEVLSMYDGMSCRHIALDKLGVDISRYYATEIDQYAIKTTMHNYPDTVQMGDAFQVRDEGWRIPEE